MDVRNIRKTFLDKTLIYACSYDQRSSFRLDEVTLVPSGLRVRLAHAGRESDEVFHVFDARSVSGVDSRQHDSPAGHIESVEESMVFSDRTFLGAIEGRMTLRTLDGALIDAAYTGVVQLPRSCRAVFAEGRGEEKVIAESVRAGEVADARDANGDSKRMMIDGKVFLSPYFDTTDSRYHWLTEHACAAFGTWTVWADPRNRRKQPIRYVTSKIDVYSAG